MTGVPWRASDTQVKAPMQPSAPVTRKDSSDILVDGDDLRVKLEPGPALLVRAEARALDPAEGHVHVRAGRLPVDPDDPGLDLFREGARGGETGGEDRRREAVLDRVRPPQRLVQVGEAVERRHRAEDLLAGEERIVGEAFEE